MRCLNPITLKTGDVVPCSQCLPCRVNRRNGWNLRLRYESTAHKTSLFVGLSYDDDNVPITSLGNQTLREEDTIHFREKLRYRFKKDGYGGFRYYLIGEYGSQTHRPHYHLQFFTSYPIPYENCMYAQEQDSTYCLTQCFKKCPIKHIRTCWPYGHATSYPCTPADIGYITLLHVTGLQPPTPDASPAFMRMSKKPAIGDCFFDQKELISRLYDRGNACYTYTPDGTLTPLPRYYRDKIFTKPEKEYLNVGISENPTDVVKSHTFTNNWLRNSWKSKGKM
ncbi:replication initiator protein [Blackfly microvirus SF02]|uniref:Replication initiator protein n=1 Tax=Blackfly microvirus SF02 TaxID=2576452 RepID=A0A4V1F5E0_9VIRU|nr:replication initiator protein [Blackfly microvirus SF02]